MPGIDLDVDLPDANNTMAEFQAMITAAVQDILDDLADQVIASEININTALSMNGNALTNIGFLRMIAGNPGSVAGDIYYSNGEFYAVDSTGVVQLTANGSVNVSGAGGIVGDYGSGPELVSYDNLTGEYRFTEDTGIWADGVFDDVILKGASGSIRLGCGAGITANRLVTFNSLPAAGVSMLVYDAATSTIEDGAGVALDALEVTDLTIDTLVHGERSITIGAFMPTMSAAAIANQLTYASGYLLNATTGGGAVSNSYPLSFFKEGDALLTAEHDTQSATYTLVKNNFNGTTFATQVIPPNVSTAITGNMALPLTAGQFFNVVVGSLAPVTNNTKFGSPTKFTYNRP